MIASWFLIFVGVLEVAIGAIGIIGELLYDHTLPALTNPWCSNIIQGSAWRIFYALGTGTIILGVQTILAGIFATEPIAKRFRGFRWLAHFFLFWFVFQILITLRLSDPYLRWWLAILASGALAFAQAYHESSNTDGGAKVMTETFWDSVRGEGWLAGFFIIVSFWVVFFITPMPTGGALAFWLLVLIWYTLFHIVAPGLFTVFWYDSLKGDDPARPYLPREILFVVFEALLITVAYILKFAMPSLSVC
jgi:hypothetical protein